MVPRGNVEHLGGADVSDPQSLVVHGNGAAPDPSGSIDLPDLSVARVLYAVDLVLAQQLHEQVIQEVRPSAYQDVFRVHPEPPEIGEIPGNGLPQGRGPPGIHGGQKVLAVVQDHFPLEPGPDGEGKLAGAVAGEVRQRGRFLLLLAERQRGGSRLRDLHRLHKESPALGRGNVALLQKLGIGRLHGGLAHLQIGGQGPLGGQLVPRGQLPGPDVLPDGQIQGFVQWLTGTFYQIVGAHRTSFQSNGLLFA